MGRKQKIKSIVCFLTNLQNPIQGRYSEESEYVNMLVPNYCLHLILIRHPTGTISALQELKTEHRPGRPHSRTQTEKLGSKQSQISLQHNTFHVTLGFIAPDRKRFKQSLHYFLIQNAAC